MPKYEINVPGQGTFEVDSPSELSDAQVYAAIQSQLGKPDKEETPKEETSTLRQAADLPVNFTKGIVYGVRALTDVLGADNPISKNLRGVEEYLGGFLSAQAKNDQEEMARIQKEAEDKGVWEGVKAGAEAIMVAPVNTIVQAFGTAIPTLLSGGLGVAGKVYTGIKALPKIMAYGTAALSGTGMGKGAIYDAVIEELSKQKLPPEAIEKAAVTAQEYKGENLDLILANTLVGLFAGGTGIEKALIPGIAKNISQNVAKRGVLGRAAATGFPEFIGEGFQGGTEQGTKNITLQRQGFDVPTFRGVPGAVTTEGLAGLGMGAGVGALSRPQPSYTPPPDAGLNVPDDTEAAPPPPPTPFVAQPPAPPPAPPAPVAPPPSQEEIDRQASYEQQMAVQNARQEQAERGNQFMTTPSPYLSQAEAAIQPGQRERAQGLAAQQFGLNVGDARAPVNEQDRIDRQLAAQQQMDGDRFQQQTPLPSVTQAQALPRVGSPTPNPQTARAFDRQAALLGQMQGLPQVEQTGLAAQADIAGRTGQVATPKTGFVALEPMTPREARQRLAVLKEDLKIQEMPAELAQFRAKGLQGPIPKGLQEPTRTLHIVPHPTVGGRYAIEQRVKPIKEAPEPRRADRVVPSVLQTFNLMENLKKTGVITPEAFAAAERYKFNVGAPTEAFQQKQTAPDIITQQRRGMADEAALNAELRGGVATPDEAQRLFETGMGRPYDAIQQPAPQSRELGLSERERRLNAEEAAAQEKANRDPEAIARRRFQEKLQGPEVDFLEGFDVNMNAEPGPASPEFIEQFMKPEGRYSLSGEATPELKETVDDIRKKLLPILKRFGLGNIGLRLVDSIENGKADGMFAQQIITLALDSDNPLGVMRHEVIHALKELGAFTPAEWKVLTKAAKDTWINQFFNRDMQGRYQAEYLKQNGNLDGFQEYLQEEAIAQAFRFFSDKTPKGQEFQRPSGMITNLMRRLNEFFKAIRDFFANKDIPIDEMFLPNRIFADIERGAIQPGRDQGRKEELPKFATKFSLRSHAVEILSNKVKPPKIEGKVTVDKVGQYFDNKVMKQFGRKLDYKNEEDFNRAVAQAKDEIAFQLKQENSGLDWYEEDIKTAFELTEKAIPELANEQSRVLFSVMAGIMSPQTNARDNWFIAAKAFQHYVATGIIPGNNPDTGGLWQGGTQSANKKVQLEFLNKMVADLGEQKTLEWLVGQHSVKEVNQFRLKYGNVKSSIGGKATDQVIGLYAFGPKVGPFVSNLNGIFDVTVDKWMTRTFNRYFGTMVDVDGKIIDAPTEPQRKAIKQLVNEAAQNANIKPYQGQSLLWFFEQRLFREIGTAAPSYGFSDGGRKFLDSTTGGNEKSGGNAAKKTAKQSAPKFSIRDFGSDKPAVRSGAQGDGAGRDGRAGDKGGINSPLEGAPSFKGASGPDPRLTETAKQYAKSKGIPFGRQSVYADVDPVFGKRVADAYEAMVDDPFNPEVIEAYQDLINQIKDQYQALADAGYKFTFFDSETDPYEGNPVNAMRDLRNNKKMAVYGTYDGYGQTEISSEDIQRNPMLEDTGLRWADQKGLSRPVLANDLFRAVHDAFGHGLEGAGFRGRGEENAFQAHAKLFTGKALGALASETRGQNSWLNFGPFGEQNQNAKVQDTVFADQKVGLMPSFTWTENIVPDTKYSLRSSRQSALRPSPSSNAGISFNPVKEDAVSFQGSHYGKARTEVLNGAKYGQGLRGAEARRLEQSDDERIKRRVYFYIPRGNNTMPNREAGVGSYVYTQKLDNILAPGPTMGRLNKEAGGDANKFESLIVDNGYDGYAVPDFGMMVVMNQDVPVNYEGTVDELQSGKKFSLRKPDTLEAVVQDGIKRYAEALKRYNVGQFESVAELPSRQYNAIGKIEDGILSRLKPFLNTESDRVVREYFQNKVQPFARQSVYYPDGYNNTKFSLRAPTTPEFKRFFKDSKVVDEKGQPLVVYHGTNQEINEFTTQPSALRSKFYAGEIGSWFGDDPKIANNFAKGVSSPRQGGSVYPVFLSIKNPKVYESYKDFLSDAKGKRSAPAMRKDLMKQGFDGIQIKDSDTDFGGRRDDFVAFYPQQIKSAFNQRPTESPDIRFSLRAPKTPEFKRFFGNSKITNPDGTPKVMYHGTARIIDEFIPKQAGAIFVTENPDFAESFADDSVQFMVSQQIERLGETYAKMEPTDQVKFLKKAYRLGAKNNDISKNVVKARNGTLDSDLESGRFPELSESYFKEVAEFFRGSIRNELTSGETIMPLYVRAENPFDYENPVHVDQMHKRLVDLIGKEYVSPKSRFEKGDWSAIEDESVQAIIRDLGHDGFYVKEGGNKNLAVYNPNQIKSAIGNRGTYDETGRILYALKNAPPNKYTKLADEPATEKAINNAVGSTFNAVRNEGTSLRNALIDKYSQLSQTLSPLPLFNSKGKLRGDMLLHSYAQATNSIKAGLVSGTPKLNNDGTIGIERSENNLANAERLADKLDTNKNVIESGLTGRGYIATIARNLRGADILAEDRAAQQLGAQQLARANQMYAALNAEIKTGKLNAGVIAKRQQEINKLRKEGKENSRQKRELQVKPEDIAWAEKQLQMTPEVQDILDIWKAVNTSLVNLYEDTGMIDKKTADKYRNQKNYVPLFKSREDLNEEAFFRTGTSPKTASKLKELKGADITRNIWENVTKQYAVMFAAAYENQTRRISVEQMRGISGDLAKITTKDDPRVNLRFRDKGEDVHAIIENPNDLAAFQSMTYQFGPVMQFFGGFTKLLRVGALLNPMFWLRQLIRDPISASITGQAGIVTPFHSAKEFIAILTRNSEEARILASRGVIGQFDTTVSLNEFLGNVGKNKQSAPGFIQKRIQNLMEIHEASDAATRVAVYKKAKAKALKDGMSEPQAVDYAVFKARESINFALTGNSPALAAARQMIPFLNATIVGLDTLYRAAMGYGLNPEEKAAAQRAFITRALIMVGMSVAYAILMSNDDEYNKLPDHVKDNNWLFPYIGSDGKKKFIRIPVPYEVGYLFKTLPEAAVRYLKGTSTGKEVAKSIGTGFLTNLPTGGTPVPQFAKPALEAITNHSFFTWNPIESVGDDRLPVSQRGRKASEVSKVLSEAGLHKIGLSPAKIDTLTKGYFAEFGNFFNELADAVLAVGSGKQRTEKDLEDMPFFKSFMADPQADKAVSTFYDHQKTAGEVANLFSKMKNEGRAEELQKLIADPEKRQMIVAAPAMKKISDVLSTINKQIGIIDRDQSKSPAERRRMINELELKRNEIANRGVQIARELGL